MFFIPLTFYSFLHLSRLPTPLMFFYHLPYLTFTIFMHPLSILLLLYFEFTGIPSRGFTTFLCRCVFYFISVARPLLNFKTQSVGARSSGILKFFGSELDSDWTPRIITTLPSPTTAHAFSYTSVFQYSISFEIKRAGSVFDCKTNENDQANIKM